MPIPLPFGYDNAPRFPVHAAAVTTGDTSAADFPQPRTVYVGGAGVVPVIPWFPENATVVNFTVPAGGVVPVSVRRVNTTDLTASLLVGIW